MNEFMGIGVSLTNSQPSKNIFTIHQKKQRKPAFFFSERRYALQKEHDLSLFLAKKEETQRTIKTETIEK